jgi:predicted RND superfamily exporter protein
VQFRFLAIVVGYVAPAFLESQACADGPLDFGYRVAGSADGVLGALGAQWMRGLQDDIYCQVGLVILVGLASKNAILIVEFSEQLRERGLPLMESTVQAATIRLRPILMISLAFILGVVPLVITTGAGENGRHSVGTTVFGGMIMATVLNLFFIPVLYLIVEGLAGTRKCAGASLGLPNFTPARALCFADGRCGTMMNITRP